MTPIILIKVVGLASFFVNTFNVVELVAKLPSGPTKIIVVFCTKLAVAAEVELVAEILQGVLHMVGIATSLHVVVSVAWLVVLCRQ